MAYGTQTILNGATLSISDRQKVAVVGRNGSGKSTLFRLIVGLEEPAGGEIRIHSETRIGYLTQHNPFMEGEKVMDFLMRDSGKESWDCAKVAAQFQIKEDYFDLEVASLAGGYQMRVKLSAILAKEPNLLLLDEPTNFLDLSTLLLLEKFLRNYKGAFMLISHDREFIKKTCDQTLELDRGKTYLFPQPLEEYLAYKKEKSATIGKHNKKILQEKEHLQAFVDRFHAKASKASAAKSKMKQIEKLKTIVVMSPVSECKIRIPKVDDKKKGMALLVEELSIGYPDKTVARKIGFEVNRGERIAIVGDNGQGKTTLLKTIAGELAAINGDFKWGSNIRVSYYAQHTPGNLQSTYTVKEYLFGSAADGISYEEIYEMAGNFLFKDDALKKKISVLSGGEKARLCLANILLQKNNVLLLDEPTNHLDFETVEALAAALADTTCTIFFVSHNRSFVETLATGIIEVKDGKAKRYLHDYQNYVYHMRRAIEMDLGEEGVFEKEKRRAGKSAGAKKGAGAGRGAGGSGKMSAGGGSKGAATGSASGADCVAGPNEQAGAGHRLPIEPPVTSPLTREETHIQLKKDRRRIIKIEALMKQMEAEKKTINEWFEANPGEYSEEKGVRMGEIMKILEETEREWLEVQARIEGADRE